jgi:pimeloyl-ACP methyl ester carboxylesterase
VVHVYFEGDGRPWLTPRRLAPDPTPRDALMLRLMTLDPAPSVYLGRPCYFAVRDPHCEPQWWTSHRYAPEIVASLNAVLDPVAELYQGVVLIGHSGGGALAMLMAGQRQDVRAVVTLAGNLDTEAWARHHGYSPLAGSLDPASQASLPVSILQRHYLGAEDEVVTEAMLRGALAAQGNASVRIEPEVGHTCCWDGIWMRILQELERALTAAWHQEEFSGLVTGVADGRVFRNLLEAKLLRIEGHACRDLLMQAVAVEDVAVLGEHVEQRLAEHGVVATAGVEHRLEPSGGEHHARAHRRHLA